MNTKVINFLKEDLNWNIIFLSSLVPIGGLNNTNYKAIYCNDTYFIRLCDSISFNINRTHELNILHKAASLKLCNVPIYFNIETGNMVSKWITGEMPTEVQVNSRFFLINLCHNLKKLHSEKSSLNFNPFNEIRKRIEICKNLNISLPKYLLDLTKKLSIVEKELKKNKHIGLCHNDLNVSNILLSQDNLYIIDYEFASTCDIFFDLATISWLLDYKGRVNLLKSYFSKFDVEDYNKLLKYIYVVKFLNALWSLIKSSCSESNYDYKNGANIIFEELYSEIT